VFNNPRFSLFSKTMGTVISFIASAAEDMICAGVAAGALVAPASSALDNLLSVHKASTPAPAVNPSQAFSSCQTECTAIAYFVLIFGILFLIAMGIFFAQKLLSPFIACCRCAANKKQKKLDEDRYEGLIAAVSGNGSNSTYSSVNSGSAFIPQYSQLDPEKAPAIPASLARFFGSH
jgi:hypothetical protein